MIPLCESSDDHSEEYGWARMGKGKHISSNTNMCTVLYVVQRNSGFTVKFSRIAKISLLVMIKHGTWKRGLEYDTVHCSGIVNLGAGVLLVSVALSADGKLLCFHLARAGVTRRQRLRSRHAQRSSKYQPCF